MTRRKKYGAQLTFRATDSAYAELINLMEEEDADQSDALRLVMEIGLRTYRKEGKNFSEWKQEHRREDETQEQVA